MKIVVLIARLLLGLLFILMGANGFLHFMKMPLPPGDAGVFLGLLVTHMSVLVFGTQLVAGILLLVGRFVPLAVALLAAVLANILAFHISMNPQGIGPGAIATILWLIVAYSVRQSFSGLFSPVAR